MLLCNKTLKSTSGDFTFLSIITKKIKEITAIPRSPIIRYEPEVPFSINVSVSKNDVTDMASAIAPGMSILF